MAAERLEQLRRRLAEYEDTQDHERILDPALLDMAHEVWADAQRLAARRLRRPRPEKLVRLIHAVALLHWARFCAHCALAPEGQPLDEKHPANEDWRRAVALYAPLAEIDPEVMPRELRALLSQSDSAAMDPDFTQDEQFAGGDGPQVWIDEAMQLLQYAETTGDRATLERAIVPLQRAMAATPTDHPARPGILSNLGIALHRRFERTEQLEDLERAVSTHEQAVAAVSADDPDRGMVLFNLAAALRVRFERTGHLEDLERAVSIHEQAVAATRSDHHNRAGVLSDLGLALRMRFERTEQLEDLERAVSIGEQAVAAVSADNPDLARNVSDLARALQMRFERTGHLEDLDRAVSIGEQAVAATRSDHPDRDVILSNLGAALRSRFERTEHLEDLNQAVSIGEQAVAATRSDHHNRATALSNLGWVVHMRFERTGRLEDLERAVSIGEQAVAAVSADNPERGVVLFNLGWALRVRFERTGRLEDLERAVSIDEQAVAATRSDHRDHARVLSDLAMALQSRFKETGRLEDLERAISIGEQAVAAASADNPSRAVILADLASALWERFERTGRLEDLNHAITLDQQALAATPIDHADPRAGRLSDLGMVLQRRFERTGQLEDLSQAVSLGEQAVATARVDHPNRAVILSNVSNALHLRFERTGQLEDMDRAISLGEQAVAADRSDHSDPAMALFNLGMALQSRFERTGRLEDLDRAVSVHEQAVAATRTDHPDRAGRLSSLGMVLHLRFERTGQLEDLNQAVSLGEQAVAVVSADDPDRAVALSNLGGALTERFERTGQLEDLNHAITLCQEAVAATRIDSTRALFLSNLSNALQSRFERTGQLRDLKGAVSTGRQAMATIPVDHPRRASILVHLGGALLARFERAGRLKDVDQAVAMCREAAAMEVANTGVRVQAGVGWGLVAASQGRWAQAVEGLGGAVGLLALLAERGLDRVTKEWQLERWQGIAGDAAACALHAGDSARAVVLLEQGRGVLLGQALEGRGPDWARLRDADSELAGRLERVREELDQLAGRPMPLAAPIPWIPAGADRRSGGQGEQEATARRAQAAVVGRGRELARQWETLVTEARHGGLDDFLRPPPYRQLRQAASGGPVVLVNVSEFRSDALIITADGDRPGVVPLPGLTPQVVLDHVTAFLAGTAEQDGRAADTQVRQVVEWLWEAIAGPVLDELDRLDLPGWSAPGNDSDSQKLPRVWWCPTGLLSVLPLHAAGHYVPDGQPVAGADGRPKSVPDRVVSSFAPTLRALVDARSREAVAPARAGLRAVAMPLTPGLRNDAPLPCTRKEAAWLRRHRFDPDPLVGERATRAAVTDGLKSHAWAHLACHGAQDLQDPSAGRLWVYDGVLQVRDLVGLHLTHARLAVLTACETARVGTRLVDEAISLASALQLAGYQHVVATLWPIADDLAPWFTRELYRQLHDGLPAGQLDPDRTARALHHAALTLRTVVPSPISWAAYTHTGP